MAAVKNENLQCCYANYFKVGHNAFEFVIYFGQFYGNEENPQLHTHIVTSPVYAKRLLEILQEAVGKHETQFGEIEDD